MKIAYLRYSQNTDIDYSIASAATGCADVRVGLLEAMVELGHEVTIVSWIPVKQRHALNGIAKGGIYDNSWMTALKWDMQADMQSFDLLFIETAATNTMYSFNDKDNLAGYGGQTSFVLHTANILYEAQGIPILINHIGLKHTAFPFSRLSVIATNPASSKELEKLSKHNYQVIFKDFDIWDGYDYTVWHHSPDTETFLSVYDICYDRPEMKQDQISFIGSPMGYSPRYDMKLEPRDPSNSDIFDLAYVGRCFKGKTNDSGRYDIIKKLYDSPEYSTLLVGDGWERQEWVHGNVTAPGKSKSHGDVYEHYNKALACIQVVGREHGPAGYTTTRLLQSIRFGCVTMGYHKIAGIGKLIGDEFVVENQNDVFNILDICCDTKAHVKEVVEYQRSLIPTWEKSLSYVLSQMSLS